MKLNWKSQLSVRGLCFQPKVFVFQGKWPHLASYLWEQIGCVPVTLSSCYRLRVELLFIQWPFSRLLEFYWISMEIAGACITFRPALSWLSVKSLASKCCWSQGNGKSPTRAGMADVVDFHVCDPSEKLCSESESSKDVMINIQQKWFFCFLVAEV